jgi:hypothetical protein
MAVILLDSLISVNEALRFSQLVPGSWSREQAPPKCRLVTFGLTSLGGPRETPQQNVRHSLEREVANPRAVMHSQLCILHMMCSVASNSEFAPSAEESSPGCVQAWRVNCAYTECSASTRISANPADLQASVVTVRSQNEPEENAISQCATQQTPFRCGCKSIYL